jgi:hypothetical protein
MLTPPEQFGIIEKGVYRSDMLHPSHFSFIKALQLKTALVLSPEVPTRAVLNFLEDNNIKLVNFFFYNFLPSFYYLILRYKGSFRSKYLETESRMATC